MADSSLAPPGTEAPSDVDLMRFPASEETPSAATASLTLTAPNDVATAARDTTAVASAAAFGPNLPDQAAVVDDVFGMVDDDSPLAGLFDNLDGGATGADGNGQQLEDVKSTSAVAGICGFRNFANTCYMNSGLQCLFATPTVVKFFTEENHVDGKSCLN